VLNVNKIDNVDVVCSKHQLFSNCCLLLFTEIVFNVIHSHVLSWTDIEILSYDVGCIFSQFSECLLIFFSHSCYKIKCCLTHQLFCVFMIVMSYFEGMMCS
jgi:hypothetical protein